MHQVVWAQPSNSNVSDLDSLSGELLRFYDEDYKIRITETDPGLRDVALFLLAKSAKTLRAIGCVSRNGFGQEGLILARGLFESLLNMAYILKDQGHEERKRRARLFALYSLLRNHDWTKKLDRYPEVVSRHGNLEQAFLKDFAPTLDAARIEHKDQCSRIVPERQSQRHWACIQTPELAIETGLKFDYDLVNWHLSNFVHSSPQISASYMRSIDTGQVEVNDVPGEISCKESLALGIDYFVELLRLVDDVFDLDKKEDLDRFKQRQKNLTKTM